MDDVRVGRVFRAVRLRRGLRQLDVASAAGVSQQLVSLLEHGRFELITVHALRRVGAALEITLPFHPHWRGAEPARLLDADHATLVEVVARRLRRAGWQTEFEYTFNVYGERGSVDVLAWRPERDALLIVEIKSRLLDIQDTLASLGRKARVVPALVGRERGIRFGAVGRVLVLPATTASRSAIARHQATFHGALPARGRVVADWLRDPEGPLAGVWFLSPTSGVGGKHAANAPPGIRTRPSRTDPASGERRESREPPLHQQGW